MPPSTLGSYREDEAKTLVFTCLNNGTFVRSTFRSSSSPGQAQLIPTAFLQTFENSSHRPTVWVRLEYLDHAGKAFYSDKSGYSDKSEFLPICRYRILFLPTFPGRKFCLNYTEYSLPTSFSIVLVYQTGTAFRVSTSQAGSLVNWNRSVAGRAASEMNNHEKKVSVFFQKTISITRLSED